MKFDIFLHKNTIIVKNNVNHLKWSTGFQLYVIRDDVSQIMRLIYDAWDHQKIPPHHIKLIKNIVISIITTIITARRRQIHQLTVKQLNQMLYRAVIVTYGIVYFIIFIKIYINVRYLTFNMYLEKNSYLMEKEKQKESFITKLWVTWNTKI